MDKRMKFKYFYGAEADQFSFYRIPKALFTDSYFKDLSSDAKILYGLMLDRMSLSIKNQWFDENNRAYIYFSIEDIMELLNCGRNKAIKSMQELDDETGIGLLRPTTQRSERLRSLALQQSRSRQELVSLQQMQRLLCRRYHLPILKQEQFLREVRLHFRHIQKQESMSIL